METDSIFLFNFKKITYPGVIPDAYLISSTGEIYSLFSEKILKAYSDKDGYLKVTLKQEGNSTKYSHIFVHRLVAWEWCMPNRDSSLVVDHIDGNKQNNACNNLEWVTIQENTIRADQMGLRKRYGEYSNTNKYSEEMIHKICKMMESGLSNMDIWRSFSNKSGSVDIENKEEKSLYNLIRRLRNRTIWHHVTKLYKYTNDTQSIKIWTPNPNSFFSESDIHLICKLACDERLRPYEIANRFNITRDNPKYYNYIDRISSILRGDTWKDITKNYPLQDAMLNRKSPTEDIDITIIRLINENKTNSEIFSEFISKPYNQQMNMYSLIKRRIYKYRKMNSIPNGTEIASNQINTIIEYPGRLTSNS